jgi:type I restriction-modification system DNA methylase subunit
VQTPSNADLIAHLRNWSVDCVVRDAARTKRTGEVFTPTALVQEMLAHIPAENFADSTKTILDPSCGNGQFLSEVLISKLENGIDFATALGSIYGVDIMQDNVETCKERLLCGLEQYRHIVEKNIVCADALSYDFTFQ